MSTLWHSPGNPNTAGVWLRPVGGRGERESFQPTPPVVRCGEKGRHIVPTGGINCRDAVYLRNLTFQTPIKKDRIGDSGRPKRKRPGA